MKTRLRTIREGKGLTVAELARDAGLSRTTVTSIESGTANPTTENISKLAKVLNCRSVDLLAGDANEHRFEFRLRRAHLLNIQKIVAIVGVDILNFGKSKIADVQLTGHGHASSTIDHVAKTTMVSAFSDVYESSASILGQWVLRLVFEDGFTIAAAAGYTPTEDEIRTCPFAIIDEIDGTTNAKRAVASHLEFNRPKSAITIALLSNPHSTCIEVGAVYAMDDNVTFSGLYADGGYAAYRDGRDIEVGSCETHRGDSKLRLIVPCYSNRHHDECARLQTSVEDGVAKGKCETYGGCRSSTMDVIDIIRNQYDAYIDCRALWTTQKELMTNSVLRLYDVAAVLPIAKGADLAVVFPDGRDFSLEGLVSDSPISIVIGRPMAVAEILDAIAPIVKEMLAREDRADQGTGIKWHAPSNGKKEQSQKPR
jgi:transcriptional regulator with XRE-family HTH domain/fructose-1,6-bisphosphatase/inositol monophosphatase family enzyme